MKDLETNHILYEKLSSLYEFVFKPLFVKAVKRTVKLLETYKATRVLEVGCGTGYSLEFYPKEISVVATDLSEKMVEISKKRALDASAQIKVLNILDNDLIKDAGPYDAVVSFSVITVVPDPQAFVQQLKSYCEPGGHIFIIMHQKARGFIGFLERFSEWPVRMLFGFTLMRRLSDYNLEGLSIVEEKPYSKIFGYVYNDLIVLKKD